MSWYTHRTHYFYVHTISYHNWLLTERGFPWYNGNLDSCCRVNSMQKTRWWHSGLHHSNLWNKSRRKEGRDMMKNDNTSIRQEKKMHTWGLTSMRDDTHIWPNELHVDTVLLLTNDDSPPQATISNIPLIFNPFHRPRVGWGYWCVICTQSTNHLFINKWFINNLFYKYLL